MRGEIILGEARFNCRSLKMHVEGRVALVTGAAAGIGLAYAHALLRNGAKHVAVLDINESAGLAAVADLNSKFGEGRAIFIRADVTQKHQLEDAYKKIMYSFKKLDIVINNAAIANDKEWELAVATNLVGLINSSLLAFQYMSKECGGGGGIVLNISSTAGLIGKDAYPMHSAVKHGVVGYSRSMGLPYHEERMGVKVMTLCPGPTQTQLLAGMTTSTLDSSWQGHFSDTLAAMQVQKPEDVAEAMLHILANGKSGSVWVCEGGKPVYEVVIPHYEKMKA